ncbi:hypothetical protein UFOVP520_29 [uncultured Caudovirales phage]|uniref:Uncharacterized protein n=1 Tax=uncultured Caudovirales phage TaxID=2100421 RepID=A0A6J5MTI2_9CAUD|nr:hypothetical protein UFOVP520_29 [uncultured Caudovirales phage]
MKAIDHLIKRHRHWINIVRKFGELTYAEDIVQEAYIKILEMDKDINEAYFYYTLRSLTMYLHSKKVIKLEITKEIEYLLNESQENENIVEQTKPYFDYIATWDYYDQMLFSVYLKKGISMRKMSRESGISFTSIYNTIRNCKTKLKQWAKENQKDLEIQ